MRSILLYLVLVGIPLIGLLGILEAGEHIVPPPLGGGRMGGRRKECPGGPARMFWIGLCR